LFATEIVHDHQPYCSSGSYSIGHDPKYKGASRRGGQRKEQEQNISRHSKSNGRTMGVI
jgi:hypothetical protein